MWFVQFLYSRCAIAILGSFERVWPTANVDRLMISTPIQIPHKVAQFPPAPITRESRISKPAEDTQKLI